MATIPAGEILDRMKKNLGVPWQENSARDTYKAGGPSTEVTGIATTVMSTFDQVKRAQAQGLNFILTHETTYWNDRDIVTDLANDPTYKIKSEFCAKNNIVIHRFHDNLHAMRPDFNFQALARDTGWSQYETAPNSRRFTLPKPRWARSRRMSRSGWERKRCASSAIQTRASVKRRWALVTACRATGDVDVIMSGEAQETDGAIDNTEYVLDAATLGVAKGQIILGHCVSEEPGMEDCTEWLKKFITEVPVRLVRAGEPYWPK